MEALLGTPVCKAACGWAALNITIHILCFEFFNGSP